MKIHLKQIPVGGLHLEGDEPCPLGDLDQEEARCAGPLHYNLEVGLSEGALWAKGSLAQPVELRCVACLERFVHSIEVASFVAHIDLGGPETVDLTPAIREDLLLNLPPHPRCDRNGGGQCKGDLASRAAGVEKQAIEAKREHDWGVLDKLKLKKG